MPSNGTTIGFSFLVNDSDGAGRVGWMEWTSGIGSIKAPYWFGVITLVETQHPMPEPPDAGMSPDAMFTSAPDAATADAGHTESVDASVSMRPDSGMSGNASHTSPVPPSASNGCACATTDRPHGFTEFLLSVLFLIMWKLGLAAKNAKP